ncbi:MAG: adenosylcobinamide-GDP ribazoletransferase [Marinosulfonomonas sp.]|nr:adenosylcobinamide-GDP ribazoletransferase [Marinosulfonomonas sp.]
MPKPDKALIALADIPTALGLLSRLPVKTGGARGAAAAWAFPVVGLILGGLAATVGWIALALGLSASLTAGMVICLQVMMTGAMHEDGLADSVDGLWGGWDKARRLEIMKDSQIGTYGVIALVLSLLLRWTALTALINAGLLFPALIAVAALSRAPMVVMMATMPQAREGGLSASVGRADMGTTWAAVGIAISVAIALLGWSGTAAVFAVAIASVAVALIALRKIKGQTGDILGATQQVSEITALLVLATTLT